MEIKLLSIAPKMLTMKMSEQRCLECFTCATFLSLSLTVSIRTLLRNSNLFETLIKAPYGALSVYMWSSFC